MRDPENVFHLAIPCADLDAAEAFYVEILGCRRARRYDDRITLDFFGDQVVCHLAPGEVAAEAHLYPRHFGVTFRRRSDFEALHARLESLGVAFLRDTFTRFAGMCEEHATYFVVDPSNNVLEFKHYLDSGMMY